MKVFVLTRVVFSENGGTNVNKPFVFLSKDDAKKGMLNDLHLHLDLFYPKFKKHIIIRSCDYYSYCSKSKILGFTIVEYKIWETEL